MAQTDDSLPGPAAIRTTTTLAIAPRCTEDSPCDDGEGSLLAKCGGSSEKYCQPQVAIDPTNWMHYSADKINLNKRYYASRKCKRCNCFHVAADDPAAIWYYTFTGKDWDRTSDRFKKARKKFYDKFRRPLDDIRG